MTGCILEFLFLIKPFDVSLIDETAIQCDSADQRLVWLDSTKEPDMPVFPKHLFEAVNSPDPELRFITVSEP